MCLLSGRQRKMVLKYHAALFISQGAEVCVTNIVVHIVAV